MIDSHCHIDCDAYDGDRDAALVRAHARGITDIVVPAVGEATWAPILALRDSVRGPRCWPTLGIHPVALPAMDAKDDDAVIARLDALVTRERPLAIGECGLDASIDLTLAPWPRQEGLLRLQLTLARKHDLPVVLHARGGVAYARLLALLEREGPLRGVLHSYGGGVHLLPRFVALGLHFGFAGPATYPSARKVRASIEALPLERLLAETDAPDQCPEPYRPGRSEPAYTAEVVAGLAMARGVSAPEMASLTRDNAIRLFRLSAT